MYLLVLVSASMFGAIYVRVGMSVKVAYTFSLSLCVSLSLSLSLSFTACLSVYLQSPSSSTALNLQTSG